MLIYPTPTPLHRALCTNKTQPHSSCTHRGSTTNSTSRRALVMNDMALLSSKGHLSELQPGERLTIAFAANSNYFAKNLGIIELVRELVPS